MAEAADLLAALCETRRLSYATIDDTWRVLSIGGSRARPGGLFVGADLRKAVPELHGREGDIVAALSRSEPFILRWVERPGPRRSRFYEVMIHTTGDGAERVCWLIDRSAYGRLKMRIDRYYAELFESTATGDVDTDPVSPFGPGKGE